MTNWVDDANAIGFCLSAVAIGITAIKAREYVTGGLEMMEKYHRIGWDINLWEAMQEYHFEKYKNND